MLPPDALDSRSGFIARAARLVRSDYGMVFVLLLLVAALSAVTYGEQWPTGDAAARQLAPKLKDARVLIVVRDSPGDEVYAERMKTAFAEEGVHVAAVVRGQPFGARQTIAQLARAGLDFDTYVANRPTSVWLIYDRLADDYPQLKKVKLVRPEPYSWPTFLTATNLLNVANQIAVIAIMAIGMTIVIIVGGIDLSVGSLIALAAVTTTRLIRDWGGAEEASAFAMTLCGLAGVAVCGLAGLLSGATVAAFRVPAFVVTLAMMLAASGLAYLLADGQSIHQVPESFIWLGREADVLGIPNAAFLMAGLYLFAHLVMARTVFGRHLYAVGGNAQAARFCGISVERVTISAYILCGALAGLGGVIMASQLKSGAPTYGQMYELFVIAAVVVGGASLSGGRGKVFGTLIGALIIAVIQNGMNLMGLESYTQKIVLGVVILAAVLLDRLRRGA